eukprot:2220435-Pyramimonas_sp.AAC.1
MYSERRRAKLWAPVRKTLPLQALVGPDGAVVSDAQAMTSALLQHWAPVFTWKQVPVQHVRRYLAQHAVSFDWTDVSVPT